MSNPEDYVPIPGSERQPMPGARIVGELDGKERIEVSVLVRRRFSGGDLESRVSEMGELLPKERSYLDRERFGAEHGADPEDLEKIKAFARTNNLDITQESISQRRVTLSGTVEDVGDAFGVREKLALYEHPGGSYRGRLGPVMVPSALSDIVQSVHGLDDRPAASPRFRARPLRPHTGGVSYTPPRLAKLYDFPTAGDGQGQAIAIIELGGGYRVQDLSDYFKGLKIPVPQVSAISVDEGHNSPTGDPNGPDGEVALDIEVAGAIAPGANIFVYFAPNTDKGFLDAISTAVHDALNKPSVVSISWGSPEDQWTAQSLTAFDGTFKDAAALGVTVCCAAGDGGSTDGEKDGLQHVDFPASSPHALGCGGTTLFSSEGSITSETVWNNEPSGGATGGGVSEVFALPNWQSGAGVPPSANPSGHAGRGVPDVAGDADPATGYEVLADGQRYVVGGTSAVAPLWSALVALLNQDLGNPVGYLNPLIYKIASQGDGAFHDITGGDNGAYQADAGWDACTGLGSPDGSRLLQALGTKGSSSGG